MSLNKTLQDLNAAFPDSDETMPALFVGHGSPMNAIEDNAFSRAWINESKTLPRPNAILCISAHWETSGTLITAMERPRTIHDFGGFPHALYEKAYPAPGSPDLAQLTQEIVQKPPVNLDRAWGLDHGTWSVLCRMFPDADIPVAQLSLDQTQAPDFHYALGKALRSLRHKGVLIVGSGNIVHNLRLATWRDDSEGFDWAIEFDETIKQLILSGNHDPIIQYPTLGKAAQLAVPTNEHYLPLLYTLALQDQAEPIRFFADQMTFGSLSMRSIRVGS
jgi:4,5-DOPA dioxygenase extradiol